MMMMISVKGIIGVGLFSNKRYLVLSPLHCLVADELYAIYFDLISIVVVVAGVSRLRSINCSCLVLAVARIFFILVSVFLPSFYFSFSLIKTKEMIIPLDKPAHYIKGV